MESLSDLANKDVGEGLNTAFDAMRALKLKNAQISEEENKELLHRTQDRRRVTCA